MKFQVVLNTQACFDIVAENYEVDQHNNLTFFAGASRTLPVCTFMAGFWLFVEAKFENETRVRTSSTSLIFIPKPDIPPRGPHSVVDPRNMPIGRG